MSIRIILKLMIKFILPIVVFIVAVTEFPTSGLTRVHKSKKASFRLNNSAYIMRIYNNLPDF